MRKKVISIVGTRPELIKMSRVIAAADQVFDHVLVHTGQNFDYELNQIFFDDLGIRAPDHYLGAAADTPIATIANVLTATDALLAQEQPDAVMIYGDTNSGLACIAAKRRKIPIFHMEAGNRSFDARVPEEINRKIIDHTSDLNFVLTEHARRYLLAEGLPADRVIKTGSHMQEVLSYAWPEIERSDVVQRLGLTADRFIIVSLHREENVDDPQRLTGLIDALADISSANDLTIVLSTHPRTRARLEKLDITADLSRVMMMPPFGFIDYIALQRAAFCVISDSGTIAEEAALLNLCAVTVRSAHERPEGQDSGAVVLSRPDPRAIANAVRVARATHIRQEPRIGHTPDYEEPIVSQKIVRVVSGYIDFINEKVWSRTS
jgi:UDP-N-acetylglucosamine 2-epimerase